MPAPKAFLRQMAQLDLDPGKAYTKSDIGKDGHVKREFSPLVNVEELKPSLSEEEKLKAKPAEVAKPISAGLSSSKPKPVPFKSERGTKKVETAKVVGEKASDESTVEPKEDNDPAAATDVRAIASVVKPA